MTDERPSVWAIRRAQEIKIYIPGMPGCTCYQLQNVCSAHWQMAHALDQAYFEGQTGVLHG